MELLGPERKKVWQKTYRKRQRGKDIVRMELQVSKESKELFDKLVAEKAEDYPIPYDKRRRIAKARIEVFNKMMSGTRETFISLSDRIESLRRELHKITPEFFKDKQPIRELPEIIQNLENDPELLKTIITKLARENRKLKQLYAKSVEDCSRYQRLYEAVYEELDNSRETNSRQ